MAGPEVDLLAGAVALLDDAVSLRRALHRRPELGLSLPGTQQAVLDALQELPVTVSAGRSVSSVVAVLQGEAGDGPTTLLRADMDALPLDEDSGVPFASAVPGAMHACGHDAHVAMLVGAVRLLADQRHHLRGRVVCMFQPGEEGHAGAAAMLDDGLLDTYGPVDRAFAIHATPVLPAGLVASRRGPLMASADAFRLEVTGRGGHASMPHDAVDPVPAACEIVTALQVMVTRRVPAFEPAVVTVTSIHAGTTVNVVPERVMIQGTVRAVSETSRQLALHGLEQVASHVAAAHGCTAAVAPAAPPYPVTVNDGPAVDAALDVARSLLGRPCVLTMPTPVMGAEDWSFVLDRVPGCMVFLGMAPPGVAHPAPNHSNRMVLDEPSMAAGIALHAAVALSSAGTTAPQAGA